MTPPDPPYDMPRLKQMSQALVEALQKIGLGVGDAERRRDLTEMSAAFQRIVQDFEAEHSKVDSEAAAKMTEAQEKMAQAQAILREAQEKAKQAQAASPPPEPDWKLGPRLRDDILRHHISTAPAPAAPLESLAPWALSAEPAPAVPALAPAPLTPQAVAPTLDPAQSVASWLFGMAPPPTDQPSPTGDVSSTSIASWMFPSGATAPADRPQPSQEAWKQWLRRSRGQSEKPDSRE